MAGLLVASLGLPTGPSNTTLAPVPTAMQPQQAPPLRTSLYQKHYAPAGGSNVCVDQDEASVGVDVSKAKVVHNNLGGIGPDTGGETVRISGMGTLSTEGSDPIGFDIVLTALSPYSAPNGGEENGISGNFGAISIGYGTFTRFRASFINSETDAPVTIPSLSVGFLDMDHGGHGDCTEVVRIIRDTDTFDGYWTNSGHGTPKYDWHELDENITFAATDVGTGSDNPTNPDDLTDDQWRKSFMVRYKNVRQFEFALGYVVATWNADHTAQTLNGDSCKEHKDRNFMMAAELNFFPCDSPVEKTSSPPPSPPPPSKAPDSAAPSASPQWVHPDCPCLTPEERASKRIQRKTHLALRDYLTSYKPEELKMTPEEHALSIKKSVLLLNDPCAPVEKVKAC